MGDTHTLASQIQLLRNALGYYHRHNTLHTEQAQHDYDRGQHALDASDLAVTGAMSMQQQIEQLAALARELDRAQSDYRRLHDMYGSGHIRTGRAWDRMRSAGDAVRKFLDAPLPATNGVSKCRCGGLCDSGHPCPMGE